jgi:hypothetical protein
VNLPPIFPFDSALRAAHGLTLSVPFIIAQFPAANLSRLRVPLPWLGYPPPNSLRIAIEITGPSRTPQALWSLLERLDPTHFGACWRFTPLPDEPSPSAVIPTLASKLLVVLLDPGLSPALATEVRHRMAGVGIADRVIDLSAPFTP